MAKLYYSTTWTKVTEFGDEFYRPAIFDKIQGRGNHAAAITDRDTPPSYGILVVSDKVNAESESDPTLHNELLLICPQQFPSFDEAKTWWTAQYGAESANRMVDQTVSGE